MPLILDNLSKHITLTPQDQELFLSKTEIRQYKSKSILLHAGEVCNTSYFVNSGVLRSFNINDNIVEHVLSFACSGWWISDMYSLLSQKPGNLFIQVMEDAEIVLLSKKNQEILFQEIPKLERFFRILTENSWII
jgi:CRP/FNR family transcriptional regulator, anaerobic regulatory protein